MSLDYAAPVAKNTFQRKYLRVGTDTPYPVRVQDFGDLIIYTFPDTGHPAMRHFCEGRDGEGVPECSYVNKLATGG